MTLDTGAVTGYVPVRDEAELRALLGEPAARAASKERTALLPVDRDWLARSPLCLLATSAPDGSCDVSPKGDPAGFVHVLDDRTIVVPDRPGNKRADGFRNVLANPHVGLLFLVPGRGDTLRINGRAELIRDAPFFDELVVKGHRPRLALIVHIEQIFFHCAKAFMRSQLWEPETWHPDALPPHAALVKAVQDTPETLAELSAYYGPQYATRLYGEPA
jgi:PPOX class probable FMN-dependent enzyme